MTELMSIESLENSCIVLGCKNKTTMRWRICSRCLHSEEVLSCESSSLERMVEGYSNPVDQPDHKEVCSFVQRLTVEQSRDVLKLLLDALYDRILYEDTDNGW